MIMFFKCCEFNVYILKYEIKIMLLLNSDPKSEAALPKHQQATNHTFVLFNSTKNSIERCHS